MTTQLSTRLAALGIALLMNAAMLGSVAYLFNGQTTRPSVLALAHTALTQLTKSKA